MKAEVSLSDTPDSPSAQARSTRLALVLSVPAEAIWSVLTEHPLPVPSLTERAGVHRATVYRWLPKLVALDLARKTPDGWVRGAADPEAVAVERGVEAIEQRRSSKHALQRSLYRRAIDEMGDWLVQKAEAITRSRGSRVLRQARWAKTKLVRHDGRWVNRATGEIVSERAPREGALSPELRVLIAGLTG